MPMNPGRSKDFAYLVLESIYNQSIYLSFKLHINKGEIGIVKISKNIYDSI